MNRRDAISSASRNEITSCLAQASNYAELHQILEKVIEEFKGSMAYKLLALDYVEHILWISQRVSRIDQRFSKALNMARGFAEGKLSTEDIDLISKKVYGAHHKLQIRGERAEELNASVDIQQQCLIDFKLGSTILIACVVCYGHEQAARGIIYKPPFQTLATVAQRAANVVGLYHAGSDWQSENPTVKQEALKRYEQRQLQEAKWQLQHLLSTVG